jgi:hypothetical protein
MGTRIDHSTPRTGKPSTRKNQQGQTAGKVSTGSRRTLLKEYAQMVSLLNNSQGIERVRKLVQLFPKRPAANLLGRANIELFWSGSGLYF